MDRMNVFHRIFFLLFFLFARSDASNQSLYKVDIDTKQYVYHTDEKFLSIALGSSLIRDRWKHFDFGSEKLHNLAKGLAPAYLRIGGTYEDFLLFNPHEDHHNDLTRTENTDAFKTSCDQQTHSSSHEQQRVDPLTNFTMTRDDVNKLFKFVNETGLNIIFGLNLLLRDSNTRHWNYTNAKQLMEYIHALGFSCSWELGNEPFDLHGLINWTITGEELAFDFKILRKLLNEHPEYGQMIVGPDVSSPWKPPLRDRFLKDFLTNVDGSIDGMTYHQYYVNNQAEVSKFYDPKILDDLITEIQQVESIMKESGASSIDSWLGETSSAYGGGVPGVSNSFIAGFMWLDKLGVAARLKQSVVIRQTFYSGSYSLINSKNLDPFPDYWSAFLYKTLVGSRVLDVHNSISFGRTIRVYAHCMSERSSYNPGSLVLIALNTQHEDVQLVLTNGLEKLTVDQYLLTPGEKGNLISQTVRLNGKVLQMVDDTFLPNVEPISILPPDKISLPPVSYGFFVIPDARVEACQSDMLS
ncbi:heparanase-like [Dendronephthya gigantea]|uniref:heparanase-like n=1 Tax=Dendronephthya gigantea TaxID=151771 RepID=UPI001069AE3F|nr:heparanase-like [Dendronephthya gigantea]